MFESLVHFIREQYRSEEFIPLHAPIFSGREKDYVFDAIDSTFVSSVGEYVNRFERDIASFTGSENAVAVVNGTAALHVALLLVGVRQGDVVVTQPLSFIATCNAIAYCGAEPAFVDVDRDTFGLSPSAVHEWLQENAYMDNDGRCLIKKDGRVVRACLPMHTFGHPVDIDGLVDVCVKWNLPLVEDAAESLGSFYKDRHTGTFGAVGTLSFNGNKILTTGGGGMLLSNSDSIAQRAKHITTTAKKPHPFEFVHDEVGFNYRLPNLNAALGCAQLEKIEKFILGKRELARRYQEWLSGSDLEFLSEPKNCRSNYWLNAVICENQNQRDALLKATNEKGVMTRPIWRLSSRLPMYDGALRGDLRVAEWLEDRVVNLPSSVLPEFKW